ncbi:MAG: type II secretion system F family protein [Minisyncoccales bacterium]
MKFNYQARTKEGEIRSGTIEAFSRESAVSFLQEQGLFVTFLEEAEAPLYARRLEIFERISFKEVALFSRQLAIMVQSKITLLESLKALAYQTRNVAFKDKIFKLAQDVESGIAFSQALMRFPKIFSPFYVAMVKSGEATGRLSEVLNYLANHLEKEYRLNSQIKGAFVYPAFVLFVVLIVLALVIFFVVPNLISVLKETGQAMPWITQMIVGFSDFAKVWGWLVLIILVLAGYLLFRFYKSPTGKEIFDPLLLKIPVIGGLLKMVYLNRIAENLSTLIAGGLTVIRSLEIVSEIVGNLCYREVILKAREEVGRGEMISTVLQREPALFPSMFIQMVMTGEKTGILDKTLINVVSFYEQEIEATINSLIRILEPLLIIILGFIVVGVILSVLLPLYQTISL